jgi:hypothetical protein
MTGPYILFSLWRWCGPGCGGTGRWSRRWHGRLAGRGSLMVARVEIVVLRLLSFRECVRRNTCRRLGELLDVTVFHLCALGRV